MNALQRLLYLPASRRNVVATRAIIALHALWILLSRWCLPNLLGWPEAFWSGVSDTTHLRYGWLSGVPERALFIVLIVLLPFAIWSRAASLGSALLLYHFAPLEDAMIGWPGPYLRGLTVDVLALAILAFAPGIRSGPDPNFRWPVTLVRFAVAAQYTFSTIGKLRTVGLEWFSAENIQDLARLLQIVAAPPHPDAVIRHPALALAIGAGWFILSISMIGAVVSRSTATVVVALVAIAHIAAAFLFGIVWLAAPLLLVFIDFDQRATPNSSAQRASA